LVRTSMYCRTFAYWDALTMGPKRESSLRGSPMGIDSARCLRSL
jgi:hypothetical protein